MEISFEIIQLFMLYLLSVYFNKQELLKRSKCGKCLSLEIGPSYINVTFFILIKDIQNIFIVFIPKDRYFIC